MPEPIRQHPASLASTPLGESIRLGIDFWNDSCDLRELGEAVREGAVGATSNPVIVLQAVQADPATWHAAVDALVAAHGQASEDELAWHLIAEMAHRAAALLQPVHRHSGGRRGWLCVQVNPQLYRNAARMIDHARTLASAAPNIAVKVPATAAGLEAMEELTAQGVTINATVSFTVAQAIASAEACERGLRARQQALERRVATSGHDPSRAEPAPVVTLMVGRLDDHLQRVTEREQVTIEPGHLHWAGVAVFKRAAEIFRARGYRAKLLAAAYRHQLHWSELVGPGIVQSIPYRWWRQFNASGITPRRSLEEPVAAPIIDALLGRVADFRRAYHEDGLHPGEFAAYGASIHTLGQFLEGYQQLVQLVRRRMLV